LNLSLQLILGNIGNILGTIWWTLVFFGSIPLLIWMIISVVFWIRKRKKILKWWAITVGICSLYGLITFGYIKVFNGAPFLIAQRINVYIPMTVDVLENNQMGARDEIEEYEVVRFSTTKMASFIESVKTKGWKYGSVVPDTLRNPKNDTFQDTMIGRQYPLPKENRDGYYYSFIEKRDRSSGDWYTTRKAYFLDVKSRILYIYFDDAQWG
jgi:hypothetical protein